MTCLYPLMLADRESERGMLPLTELGHGRQGQINEMGGVEWVSNLHVSEWRANWPTTWMQNAPAHQEVLTLSYRGVELYPSEQPDYK